MARPRRTRVVRSRRFELSRMFKRPQTYFAAALPLAIPIVLAALTGVEPSATPSTTHFNTSAATLRYIDLTTPFTAALPEHSMILTVEEDDTLDGVLTAGGLNRADAGLLTREFGKTI